MWDCPPLPKTAESAGRGTTAAAAGSGGGGNAPLLQLCLSLRQALLRCAYRGLTTSQIPQPAGTGGGREEGGSAAGTSSALIRRTSRRDGNHLLSIKVCRLCQACASSPESPILARHKLHTRRHGQARQGRPSFRLARGICVAAQTRERRQVPAQQFWPPRTARSRLSRQAVLSRIWQPCLHCGQRLHCFRAPPTPPPRGVEHRLRAEPLGRLAGSRDGQVGRDRV